jgi:hypothetical protein
MENNKTTASGGIGFTGLLQIVFIVLKLCGVIAWPWKWVLAPIWISAIITAVFLLGCFLLAIIKALRED